MILIHYVSFESNLLYMKKKRRKKNTWWTTRQQIPSNPWRLGRSTTPCSFSFWKWIPSQDLHLQNTPLIFNCMHLKITHTHTWSKKQSKHEPLTLIISTRVFRYGLFWDHSNSYKPGSSSEPIALRQLAAGSGRRTRTARPGVGGTRMARPRCNLLFWNFCTDQQKVGTYSRLCICPPRWPMMMHPILNRTDTLVLREMWHRSFLDTF